MSTSDPREFQGGGPAPGPFPNAQGEPPDPAGNAKTYGNEASRHLEGPAAAPAADRSSGEGAEAGGFVEDLQERAQDFVEGTKDQGAERITGMADAIERAAVDLESELPGAAAYVRDAARGVSDLSRAMRERSAGELFQAVHDFARRDPAAFFGSAVLAGFALSRFVKATVGPSGRATATTSAGATPSEGVNAGRTDDAGQPTSQEPLQANEPAVEPADDKLAREQGGPFTPPSGA